MIRNNIEIINKHLEIANLQMLCSTQKNKSTHDQLININNDIKNSLHELNTKLT